MSWLLALLPYGKTWLGLYLDHLRNKAATAAEQEKVKLDHAIKVGEQQLANLQDQRTYWIFWVPWSLVTIPFSLWLGWGFLDSFYNGTLPDVAALPPQLKEYGDIVMGNLFYSAGIMRGVEVLPTLIRSIKR